MLNKTTLNYYLSITYINVENKILTDYFTLENSMQLSIQQYEVITDFIYQKSGLKFDSRKQYFIDKRVNDRMDKLRITEVNEYIRFLKFNDFDKKEFQLLINAVTTNESFFFRDYAQLQSFAEHCLTEVVTQKAERGSNNLRIWSAGCSRGEEPYSLAIILNEILGNVNDWNIEILATDIDADVLNKANIAIFDYRAVKEIPDEYVHKYFTERNGMYYLSSQIKSMVKFMNQNLNDQTSIKKMKNFDFIFCRNVLIYFDEISRKRVVDNFYLSLNTGGYVFLGSSESIARITNAFTLKRKGNYLVYKKE